MTNQADINGINSAIIIGAGNVAWHLGHQLVNSGITIVQVYNRTPAAGQILAKELGAGYTGSENNIYDHADLCVIAITDDVIENVCASGCLRNQKLVIHTAGSVNMHILKGSTDNYGVLYPLQTLSRGKSVQFDKIPLLIEGNNAESLQNIRKLALRFSPLVVEVNSDNRLILHMAAVLSANFSNHMFALAEKILSDKNLSFDLLRPLIEETVEKAFDLRPLNAQTGPAVRGSREVIEKHLRLLSDYPEVANIYRMVSDSIFKMYGK